MRVLILITILTRLLESLAQDDGDFVDETFRFQNLGESCSPRVSDDDNWEIYEQFTSALQQVLIMSRNNRTMEAKTFEDEAKNLQKTHGQGSLCHPKFVCVPDGFCECRPGFTFEIENYVTICKVDANFPCSIFTRYFACGRNASCEESSLVNRKPNSMPGLIGEEIKKIHADTSEMLCICGPGRICQRLTVGAILERYNLRVQPSTNISTSGTWMGVESSGVLTLGTVMFYYINF